MEWPGVIDRSHCQLQGLLRHRVCGGCSTPGQVFLAADDSLLSPLETLYLVPLLLLLLSCKLLGSEYYLVHLAKTQVKACSAWLSVPVFGVAWLWADRGFTDGWCLDWRDLGQARSCRVWDRVLLEVELLRLTSTWTPLVIRWLQPSLLPMTSSWVFLLLHLLFTNWVEVLFSDVHLATRRSRLCLSFFSTRVTWLENAAKLSTLWTHLAHLLHFH